MRLALRIEYDGTAYCGWQRQDHGDSIQARLEHALSRVADHPVTVICAGRTDAGVHALAQIVHFETTAVRTAYAWLLGTNSYLPPDIAVHWVHAVPITFHARHAAHARHYRYLILNRPTRSALWHTRASWVHHALDDGRMATAAAPLVGEHDFTSFRALACQAKHAVRTVYRLEVRRQGEFILIDVSANAFLHHMVRNIAGVLIAIGKGRHPPEWAAEVLAARNRACAGVTAPPSGLYLMGVEYPAEFALPTQDTDTLGLSEYTGAGK